MEELGDQCKVVFARQLLDPLVNTVGGGGGGMQHPHTLTRPPLQVVVRRKLSKDDFSLVS
jgi:hypothetical protein